MASGIDDLSPRQQELLARWLPGAVVEHDHSWGDVGTTVLQMRGADGHTYIAKAGDERDHHIAGELAAHRQWLTSLASRGDAPRLINGDADAKIVITEFLPGELVQSTPAEWEVDTYRQAGRLLARLHRQHTESDDGEFELRQKKTTLAWLDRPHQIAPEVVSLLRETVESWATPPSVLVPTHGDWQPRNWLVHQGRITMIDFGRTELRPAHTDFTRLAAQQFRTDPALEPAFLEGYGPDPREPDAWLRTRIREAVSTAGWARQVGAAAFEQQGLRMVADVVQYC